MPESLKSPSGRLKAARMIHLKDIELEGYSNQQLAAVTRARVRAHLKVCLLCRRRYALLEEEAQYLSEHSAAQDPD